MSLKVPEFGRITADYIGEVYDLSRVDRVFQTLVL